VCYSCFVNYESQRCEQFVRISPSKAALHAITSRAKSFSVRITKHRAIVLPLTCLQLPDFAYALESYEVNPHDDPPPSSKIERSASPDRPSSRASSSASQSVRKLRYKAYDAPKATPRLRANRPTSPSYSTAHSESGSSRFVGQDADDSMTSTITAGDLALATGHIELQNLPRTPPEKSNVSSLSQAMHSMGLGSNDQVNM
jgi:AP-4 complex subunit epsilon-1